MRAIDAITASFCIFATSRAATLIQCCRAAQRRYTTLQWKSRLRYAHSCLELVILITTNTNKPNR